MKMTESWTPISPAASQFDSGMTVKMDIEHHGDGVARGIAVEKRLGRRHILGRTAMCVEASDDVRMLGYRFDDSHRAWGRFSRWSLSEFVERSGADNSDSSPLEVAPKS